MKIAFLIYNYAPSRGGQERYLARLAGALAGRGHEIHVFSARAEREAAGNIRLHLVRAAGKNSLLKMISYIRAARVSLAREKFDIVSGMTRFYPLDVFRLGSGIHEVWLEKKSDSAVSRALSRARPFNRYLLGLERKMFTPANCARIIANSRLCRGHLLSRYDYPAERVTVVYNGIDASRFHPGLRDEYRGDLRVRLGVPPAAAAALFLSNNPKRKGLDIAIRALSLSPGRGTYLLAAGSGRTGPYRRLAEKLGVAGRVRFLGRVADVRPLYGSADFLILPTRYDPFANVCLEGMACGLPVITTRDNGASEIIEEGVNGFVVVDPRDEAAFASGIASLAEPAFLAGASAGAREKSLAYTIDRNADETLNVYRKVLEEKNAGKS